MMVRSFAFEQMSDDLKLLPLAARRALDVAGRKLSLVAWQRLEVTVRRELCAQGSAQQPDAEHVRELCERARPPARVIAADDERRLQRLPELVVRELGAGRPLTQEQWSELRPLERFALLHELKRGAGQRLERAYDEIVAGGGLSTGLTHLSAEGEARMVDVGAKPVTERRAVASTCVRMLPATAQLVADGAVAKGDVLATARIAGIMAAKRTPELIPLCHAIALTRVELSFEVDAVAGAIHIEAVAEARDRTGVEMEAMVAASVAALTIYDMLKAVERSMVIECTVLTEKSGGRSGDYRRAQAGDGPEDVP
jgi:cyclic pyranopterin phosphate synthase